MLLIILMYDCFYVLCVESYLKEKIIGNVIWKVIINLYSNMLLFGFLIL